MILVRRADEAIVGDVEPVEELAESSGHFVRKFTWSFSEVAGFLGHFQAVLVGPGLETNIAPHQPLETGDDVGSNRFVGMADMRLAVGIVDCGGNVERVSHLRAR